MVGKKFGVEGVSWLEQVFDMVAARSPNHPPLSLQIPDTVAFRYQRPAALYVNDATMVPVHTAAMSSAFPGVTASASRPGPALVFRLDLLYNTDTTCSMTVV